MQRHTVGVCLDGKIAYLSNVGPAAHAAGMSEADFIGSQFWRHVTPAQQQRLRAAFAEALLTGETVTVECETHVGGVTERWRSVFRKVNGPIAVLIHTELFEPFDDRGLTKREREIAKMVRDDMTIAQIADELRCTESTVTTHLSNIRAKLGVQTNAGIAVWSVRAGL